MDTIVALATARGRAGVAVVRVSGDRAWTVCEILAGQVPEPRQARLMILRDQAGELLDSALVLTFEHGRSFTGERVCEFQIHGSIAVATAVIRACLSVEGVRAAEPGEFTQRAFLAGRMDLTEVEALADLIDAETEAQRRQALRVLDGSASRLVDQWRDDLVQALAMIEASLDFADEELPTDLSESVLRPIERVQAGVSEQLRGRDAVESIRDGFEVAIIGRVNTGKSTLLNAMAGRDAAITSERAGTTRDVIEVRMDIAGLPVTLIDTAGLRETDDEVERIGIGRGKSRAAKADLRVFLKADPEDEPTGLLSGDIVVLSKADLWNEAGVSGKTGEGLEQVLSQIEQSLAERVKESSLFCRERHFDNLSKACVSLESAVSGLMRRDVGWEIVSVEVHNAIRRLDGIVGRIDVEDILGRVFSSFCIGK